MQCKEIRHSLSWIILERLFDGTVNAFFQGIHLPRHPESIPWPFQASCSISISSYIPLVEQPICYLHASKRLFSYSSLLSPSVNPHRPRVAFTSVAEAAVLLLSDEGANVEKREDWIWSIISTMLTMYRRQYVLIKQSPASLTLNMEMPRCFLWA